ncbi:hypothetical protein CY34DRAFT_801673 [Suillus luteus UH-Slu-Lm8-n1]|uniref:Uncharacterized protein n=1 Tax=Suillus luteus UH-Slu-Lm8-n1 TaxID=930992 RepID=A0A0D0B624_9AGAM|nr:hypothetical protein CY34DRAFT_801673 [Suillus luteus UH-Slu-Lm8-n1]
MIALEELVLKSHHHSGGVSGSMTIENEENTPSHHHIPISSSHEAHDSLHGRLRHCTPNAT